MVSPESGSARINTLSLFVCLSLNAEKLTCNLNNIIKFNRYSNYDKVWIRRFIGNLRRVKTQKTMNESILKPTELKEVEKLIVKANQFEFHLTDLNDNSSEFRDLNVKLDEEGILRCEGRLKFAPISQKTKSPILLNDKHPLSKLIILNIHESNKHISAKYTLNEFRQKFWLHCGRCIVQNITRACVICRKRLCKSYRYPLSPPLTPLRLKDFRPIFTAGIDDFRPVFVRNIFLALCLRHNVENDLVHKAWVALYTCAVSRAICVDVVHNMNSTSFIRSFKRFISHYGYPDNVISDIGSDFVSHDSINFVASRL